ncbi:MAG: cohesin domain-containing protein, partial [Candidatus Latescibacterota bacterium]
MGWVRKLSLTGVLVAGVALLPHAPAAAADGLQVSVPDTVYALADSAFTVPVTIAAPQDAQVLSASFALTFDAAVLRALGVSTDGTVASAWSVSSSDTLEPGVLRVALAGTAPLAGGGTLAYVRLRA